MFSANAIKVLQKRYFIKDAAGQPVEDVEALFRRVANGVAEPEARGGDSERKKTLADQFFNLMYKGDFLPNSPTLMNAGKPNGQLSACFVLPVPDSLEGIFETCKNAALIHKTGGGTGFSFSRLRPYNDPVASSTGVASGPVSFMCVYDAATEAIRQGGTRRGANMGILRVDHPDIELFITAKRDTEKLNNFNISVAITDAFMEALANDQDYDLIHPRSGLPVRRVSARKIFELIVENAHATGEPGVVFIDRINQSDPVKVHVGENGEVIPGTEDIEATNPCGEQPLGPGDACNLGSINVANFIDEQAKCIDWLRLNEAIRLAVRFLDNVIDANHYPLPFIANATLNNRRIGLGIMGWAEALIKMGIPYNSENAINQAESFMKKFQEKAHQASIELAEERGVFPNWPFTSWGERGIKMRNATVTTIAPTGTISIIAGTSSGIEPLFAISFIRRVLGGMELVEVNPLFEKLARERGFFSDELMERIAQRGTLKNIDEVPADVKEIFVCSHDIDFDWHVRMQAAFQVHTDNAVSKTINFPHTASVHDVKEAYLLAWKLGLKGITVYRDASRRSQVLNIADTDPLKQNGLDEFCDRVTSAEVVSLAKGDQSQEAETNAKKQYSRSLAGTAESPQKSRVPIYGPATPSFWATGYGQSSGDDRFHTSDIQNGHVRHNTKLVHRQPSSPSPKAAALLASIERFQKTNCPECGYSTGSLVRHEACLMCVSCGYTRC